MSKNPNDRGLVITASALLEGDVVYLDAAKHWVRHLDRANSFPDTETARQALDAQDQRDVIGAYLMDTRPAPNGGLEPVHFREDFRRTGPSNRFLGKQADPLVQER